MFCCRMLGPNFFHLCWRTKTFTELSRGNSPRIFSGPKKNRPFEPIMTATVTLIKTNDVSCFFRTWLSFSKGGDLSIFQATVRLFCDMNISSHGENVRCCQRLLPRYMKRHGHEGNNLPEAKRWSWKPTMNMVDRGYVDSKPCGVIF